MLAIELEELLKMLSRLICAALTVLTESDGVATAELIQDFCGGLGSGLTKEIETGAFLGIVYLAEIFDGLGEVSTGAVALERRKLVGSHRGRKLRILVPILGSWIRTDDTKAAILW